MDVMVLDVGVSSNGFGNEKPLRRLHLKRPR